MLMSLYLSIVLINMFCFLHDRRNKIIGFLSMLFVILFVAGKRYDGSAIAYDLYNYMLRYSHPDSLTSVEYGFRLVNIIASRIGLSFDSFYAALTSICLIIIFRTVLKINANIHLFLVAYLVYFILCPIDQLRNLCAFAALFSAFPLIKEGDKRNSYKFRLFVHIILAASFHITFIMYLIFFIVDLDSEERKIKPILYATLFFTIFVSLTNSITMIFNVVRRFLALFSYMSSRYTQYTFSRVGLSFIAPIAILFFSMLGVTKWKKYHKYELGYENNAAVRRNYNTIINVLMVSSCFFPLLLLNNTAYRFIRDITLIAVTWIGIDSDKRHINLRQRFIMLMFVLGISIGWFVYDIVIKEYLTDYMEHFFVNVILDF